MWKPSVHQESEDPNAVIVASRTLDYDDGLKEWNPERKFYCKRKRPWLESIGAEVGKKFERMS